MPKSLLLSCVLVFSLCLIGCDKSGSETPPVTDVSVQNQPAEEPIESKIIGKWKINVPLSVEKVKTSPKVKPGDIASIPSVVERMAGKIQMEITETEMIAVMGSRSQALAYTVTASDPKAQTVTLSINQAPDVTVVCTMIDDVYMNQVSSATDDMNYYIWEPAE